MEYDNTNRGVLFKNDRKEEGDKKPDYTGSLNVAGVDHFLDAWIKSSAKGKFMSISVKRKDKQAGSAPPQQAPRPAPAPPPTRSAGSGFDDMDDEKIPF